MRKLKNEELNRLTNDEYKKVVKNPVILVLDNIRSLHNIGSAFRTADAFLIEEIILCGITAKPPHRDINKTALGATETVNWNYFETPSEVLNYLDTKDYKVISVEQADKSIPLQSYDPSITDKIALVFGNEVFGVEDQFIDNSTKVLEIPQFGSKHSFNISVSIGICLWQVFRNRLTP